MASSEFCATRLPWLRSVSTVISRPRRTARSRSLDRFPELLHPGEVLIGFHIIGNVNNFRNVFMCALA